VREQLGFLRELDPVQGRRCFVHALVDEGECTDPTCLLTLCFASGDLRTDWPRVTAPK